MSGKRKTRRASVAKVIIDRSNSTRQSVLYIGSVPYTRQRERRRREQRRREEKRGVCIEGDDCRRRRRRGDAGEGESEGSGKKGGERAGGPLVGERARARKHAYNRLRNRCCVVLLLPFFLFSVSDSLLCADARALNFAR